MRTWQKVATLAAMSTMFAGLPAAAAVAAPPAAPLAPYGAIGAEWNAKGGASGFLGEPLNNEYSISSIPGDQVPPGAREEDFAAGSIYWSPGTGAHEVHGYILASYVWLASGPAGYGLPLTDETTTPDGAGRYSNFQGGSIYWTPETGAHTVYGAIRTTWLALGAERSFLGYPTSDESPAVGGRYNNFQGGAITWSPTAGAHETHGSIRGEWAALGYERSFLGFPVTNETATSDGVGRYNDFQGGAITWSPTAGAHETHGAIRAAWASLGYERSALGFPTSDEHDVVGGGGRISDFEGGYIDWVNGEITVHVNGQVS
jgi:uncharacterized protein with LGFP repeats